MDNYPQPRPVLYGTNWEEDTPQTQTAPVRIGPPRYPPAPPLAGDAPEPFDEGSPRNFIHMRKRGKWVARVLELLYKILRKTRRERPAEYMVYKMEDRQRQR